ncbi:MAG TPA: transporter [Pseudonocardiaceae bacterium]|jgi:hypothetical protein|nr:transporter [Pseudonocardiaceae bacterium]
MTRFFLVLLTLLFFVLCAAAMRWGWRNRVRRQLAYLPAFPQPPAELPTDLLLAEASGVYVGTTTAGVWQDRIAVGDIGHRAVATISLSEQGLLFDRVGASPLWIPASRLVEARTDRGLAGKAMGIEGLLVVRWRVDEHEFDSGLRGDDKDVYAEWIDAVNALAGRAGQPTAAAAPNQNGGQG